MIATHRLRFLLGFAALCLAQDSGKDLGSVLSDRDELSTFYDLIKVNTLEYHIRAKVHG